MKRDVEGYFRKIFEGKELEVVEKPKQLGGVQVNASFSSPNYSKVI
jgi:hypothetical protein